MSLSVRHPDTPGAYLQRYDSAPPRVASLRTDIVGFVGIAERGPLGAPVVIESFRQFQAIFGGFIGGGFLAYSLRAFFENGGRRARVVRVASDDPVFGAVAAASLVPVLGGGAGWTVSASSPGVWGNALAVSYVERTTAQTIVDQARSTADAAAVGATAGFAANTLVRLRQPGAPIQIRVLAGIDAAQRVLYWIDPHPSRRGARQRAVTGFDPNRTLLVESLEYDLLVFSQGRLQAVYQRLSLVPENANYAAALLQPIDFTRDDRPPGALPTITVAGPEIAPDAVPAPLDIVSDAIIPLTGGRDGLEGLAQNDFIGDPIDAVYSGNGLPVRRGLAALADASDVAMLAVPDILIRPMQPPVTAPLPVTLDPCPICPPPPPPMPPAPPIVGELPPVFPDAAVLAVQAAMIEQCETLRDRIALLDPPWDTASSDRVGIAPVQAWRDNFDSAFGALYFPWVAAPDPLHLAPTRAVPPSGHVAGLIGATDVSIGVHKAPANTDLYWVQDVTVPVDAAAHGVLNTAGVNVIRAESGRPLRVLGARTVSSDPTFRFLNVRRLVCMIRAALDLSTQWAVFEPNDAHTRASLAASIGDFLTQLWRQGALAGANAGDAFTVRCDDTNNPASARALGELHADLALAPSVPFEFVLLRLGRNPDSLEITERGVLAAGVG